MKGMTVIVRTVTRWVKVFIFLYGIYIIITGHLAPGGGYVFAPIHNIQADVPPGNAVAMFEAALAHGGY